MKLLESYSNSCSIDIKHRPRITEKYFPLISDKYITIQTKSGMPAKDFSNFQEVINILRPILDKENIKIIHLGQDSTPLNGVINLNNQTSIHQALYVLKRGLLHFGVDSWLAHAAAAEEIPLVSLYGSTTIQNHAPYHFNPDKCIFLESHRNGQKATFAREENPKSVDLINPEEIGAAICKLLKLDFNYEFKTVNLGKAFHVKLLESACDNVIDTRKLGTDSIILRLDYNFNLAIMIEQLKISKCSIITSQPIPINILQQFSPNILEVLYKIDKNHNPLFVKELQDNKIKHRLYSELSDEELNKIKLDYIDFSQIIGRRSINKPEVLNKYDINNLWYKSSKLTLGRGKCYSSKWAYSNDIPLSSLEIVPIKLIDKNLNILWEEEEYCLFLEKTIDKSNLVV